MIDRTRQQWCPRDRARLVAGVANIGRPYMPLRLGMAIRAQTQYLAMIHVSRQHRPPSHPNGGHMAGLADVGAVKV